MLLNLVKVAGIIADYADSDAVLVEFYDNAANAASNDLNELYEWDCSYIDAANRQTWEMVHYYESRYGLDYVNNELHWSIENIPTFDEWFATEKAEVAARGIIVY